MAKQTFKERDVIIQEGSIGACAFIIESGKVELSGIVNGEYIVHSVLGKNQIFGEMGLITDEPREHTATAIEETVVRVITRETFSVFFLKGDTDVLAVISTFLERLRTAKKTLISNPEPPKKAAPPVQTQVATPPQKQEQDPQSLVSFIGVPFSEPSEDIIKEKIVDNRYILMYGVNEISNNALRYQKIEIKKFPFRVGRETREQVTRNSRLKKVAEVNENPDLSPEDKEELLAGNDLYILEEDRPFYISANHFLVDKVGGVFTITDRGSRLGIIVNDSTVKESCMLEEQNELIIGSPYSPFILKLEIKGKIENVVQGKANKDKGMKQNVKESKGQGNASFQAIDEEGFSAITIK